MQKNLTVYIIYIFICSLNYFIEISHKQRKLNSKLKLNKKILTYQRKLASLDPEKRIQNEKKSEPKEVKPVKKEENNSNGHANDSNLVVNDKPIVINNKPVVAKKQEKPIQPEEPVPARPKPLRTFQGNFFFK